MWEVALLTHQTKLISLKLYAKTGIKLFSAQDNKSNISSWIDFFFMITLKVRGGVLWCVCRLRPTEHPSSWITWKAPL